MQIVLLVAHVAERFLVVLFEDRLNACYWLLIRKMYLCQRLLAKSTDKALGMIAFTESGNTFTIYGLLTNGTRASLNLRLGKSWI